MIVCEDKKSSFAVVVNFGGQYAHLISRRIRELGVYTEVVPYTRLCDPKVRMTLLNADCIVFSGGPASISEFRAGENILGVIRSLIESGKPLLGVCFGHQLIAWVLGGSVGRGLGEYGKTRIRVLVQDELFRGWGEEEDVWMSHRDEVSKLPECARVLALSERGVIAAFKIEGKPVYGVQFHPEVVHTPKGRILLDNFLRIAGARREWNPAGQVDRIIDEIRSLVDEDAKVLAGVSGGVDSTVATLLVKMAIGKRLVPVLVDHGLFREGEVQEIIGNLKKIGIDPIVIDAKERFLGKLWGVRDCEERRRIIGEEFARIFKEIAESDPQIKFLLQGTTYPDVIESGFEEGADKIKSHHNVAGLPEWLGLKVIEPLRNFYKDEVRSIGRALGVPEEIVNRHPFPGPGLAVRVIGEFTRGKLEIVRKASRIVEEELKKNGLYYNVWQAFAVVGDDKWVGVKGDARHEGYIVTVRIVVSEDAMTADWARIPYEVLDRISRRITSEIDDVTMVTYAISSKPPSTIEPC